MEGNSCSYIPIVEEESLKALACNALLSYGKAWQATKRRVKYAGVLEESTRWQIKTFGELREGEGTGIL